MSTTPQLVFQIRPEAYATLTLEAFQSLGSATPTGITLGDPPMPQPGLDEKQLSGSDVPSLLQAVQAARFSKAWLQWFWLLKRFVTQGGSSNLITILAPSIDETDIGWYGTGTVNNSDDPVTFNVTLTGLQRFGPALAITNPGSGYSGTVNISIASSNGQGRPAKGTAILTGGKITGWTQTTQGYNLAAPLTVTFSGGGGTGATAIAALGRQFAVGDFIIWNDPTIVSAAYSYEIDQITAITPTDDTHFSCKLARHANGAATGYAQYGSKLSAHTGANFYRLINKEFFTNLDVSAGPQLLRFLWDNMCIAAVAVSGSGISLLTNLAPTPYLPDGVTNNTRSLPPAPGLRTMCGAAYTSLGISGGLSVGATSASRISAQAWESIRTIYAKVQTAPTGAVSFGGDANAAIVIWVCYISPPNAMGTRTVGLLDCLVIDTGNFTSYPDGNATSPNVPDGRQMPYHGLTQWTRTAPLRDWPPNYLPVLTGALDSNGNLQLGTAPAMPNPPSGTTSVQFSPDGQIDFIIGQVGSTIPGANLVVTVQT